MVKDTITSAGTSATTTCGINCCPQRLPCGICRLTMTTCPKSGYTIGYPTWDTTPIKTNVEVTK